MDNLRAPEKFHLEARDLANAWKQWKVELQLFIDLTMDTENDVAMVTMFLNLVDTQWKKYLRSNAYRMKKL